MTQIVADIWTAVLGIAGVCAGAFLIVLTIGGIASLIHDIRNYP